MTEAQLADRRKLTYTDVFEEVWNRGNLDHVSVAYHPDLVLHSPASPEPIRGVDGYRAFVQMVRAGFPDVQVTIEELVADGDIVAGRLRMRMTHTGPYFGIPPTGICVEATQIYWVRFEGGKIREMWQEIDAMGMAQQLGVVPPPGIAPLRLVAWMARTMVRFARLEAASRR